MSLILDTVRSHLPRQKTTPTGWISFNCPACVHFGHRPDTRGRGGINFSHDGFSYHCFNCGFKAGWSEGHFLGKKTTDLMEYLEIPRELITKCKLSTVGNTGLVQQDKTYVQNIYKLPQKARKILDLVEEGYSSNNFIRVLEYIGKRNINLLDWGNLYYADDPEFGLNKRFIMPVTTQGQVVGWAARYFGENTKQKYILQTNKGFLYNSDVLYSKYRKFCIVTEGNLDAISIDGVAAMGYELNSQQIKMLNDSDQIKIILPDKDKNGRQMIQYALDNNWWVSFPTWDYKDVTEAVADIGRVAAMTHIMDNLYKTSLKIKLQERKYFGVR